MSFQTFDFDSSSTPLDKYSSAVSAEGSRNHRWVHDLRKELLTLTFKTVDIPIGDSKYEKRLFMAVTAGKDSLVSLLPCLSHVVGFVISFSLFSVALGCLTCLSIGTFRCSPSCQMVSNT